MMSQSMMASSPNAEGDQPQSPEGLIDRVSYAVQAKEEHSKRLALRLVEDRERLAGSGECERRGVG